MTGAISKRTAGVLATAMATVSLFGLSSIAHAAGTYSVRPGESDPNDPATRAYFKPALKAGQSTTRTVVVTNTGRTSVRLHVYAVDGLTGQTTGTVYANRRDKVRKAGRWIKPRVRSVTLAPGQQTSVPFTISVPKRTKAGDHVAGMVFEDAKPTTTKGRFRITEIIRQVVGIQIRVPGKASPKLALGGMQLKTLPGTNVASVVVGLGNSGGKLCKPKLAVALRGPGGYKRQVARPLDTVLPATRVAYPLRWPGILRNGKYRAKTTASCQGKRVARTATVSLGKSIGPGAKGKRASSNGVAGVPLWVLVVAAVGCIGTGVALGRIRGGKGKHAAPPAADRS